ncbi:ABC transporter permease [Arthrobacter globiformis]|uniref:ABC transporter permease n=1 Tax=Arthrobacter globiformis TaxID=1665 RepID=UPI0027896C72|nr:ABC transporter permease [Arthrobacter globiformis]MDQ0867491.1 ribose/xylose/arabinose/galactoside ABC-type transport system permease subunit [Arthrobacter globiformis]
MTATASITPAGTGVRPRNRILELAQSYGAAAVLLLICAITAVFSPAFASTGNLSAIITAACFMGLITVGQSFVLISGGIDLSVGSMVGLGTVLAAIAAPAGLLPALLAPVIAGALVGLVNGLLIGKARMAPFIVTLSALLAVKGLAVALAASSLTIDPASSFNTIANGSVLGINNLIWILILAFAAAGIVLNRTRFGSTIFALGGNEEAAKMLGVDVARVKTLVYVISGSLAGLAGALLASRLSAGVATLGAGYELRSIAAAVIGGVLLTGGVGTMLGALCGVLLLSVIDNVINQIGTLNAYYQDSITGLFLVLAVVVQSTLTRKRRS